MPMALASQPCTYAYSLLHILPVRIGSFKSFPIPVLSYPRSSLCLKLFAFHSFSYPYPSTALCLSRLFESQSDVF